MPFYLLAAGGNLYRMTSAGVATALSLPTGVTISTTRPTRFAILDNKIVAVNGPNRNLWIDPDGTVRPMGLAPPATAPVLSDGGAGGYTGTVQAAVSFLVRDTSSNAILAESPLGPTSNASGSLSSRLIRANGVPVSQESAVNARRIYRTTTGPGEVFFPWIDLDDNTVVDVYDDMSDAALQLISAPEDLGNPPGASPGEYLKHIVEWRGRLWAIPSTALDNVLYTSVGKIYAWDPDNELEVAPIKIDEFGNQAFVPRRDELGVLKRDSVSKIIGLGTRFEVKSVATGPGCVAPGSVAVFHDIGIWLGEDGVYTFANEGVKNVSEDKVHSWFTTDDTFARSEFPNAIGMWNPVTKCYRLLLAPAGSTSLTRWVEYDPREKRWYGPHKTDAMTPCWLTMFEDGNDLSMPIIASTAGFLYKMDQSAITDDGTAVDMEIHTPFHSGNAPDIDHYWGELSVLSKVEAAGTMTVTPYLGGLDASAGSAITHTLTTGRERLRRLGNGRLAKLVFRKNVVNQGATVFGYELPFHELGRR